jgi:hypothetical protein
LILLYSPFEQECPKEITAVSSKQKKKEDPQKESGQPPQPPEVERRLQFHREQLIGVPIIMLLPVLALLGLFGPTFGTESASGSQIEMQVEHPTRVRYKTIIPLEITVRNVSAQDMPTVTVSISADYIANFTEAQFVPEADEITEEAYKIELSNVGAGESRQVNVGLRPDLIGNHTGEIVAEPEGGEATRASIGTFILP